jgi:predicted ABC-type transport system involved in lysophospholipase L1 biosynthesis ATPase subunit
MRSISACRARVGGHRRRVGLGQEHAAVDHGRSGHAQQRPGAAGGTDLFSLDEDARAAVRARKVGFVFQSFQLLGNLNALENVMLPLELRAARCARACRRDAAACGPG